MKNTIVSALLLLVSMIVSGQKTGSLDYLIADERVVSDFSLASQGLATDIYVDSKDSKTVLLAADLFSEDVKRITGLKPKVKSNIGSVSSNCVIIGSIEGSELIKKLIKKRK